MKRVFSGYMNYLGKDFLNAYGNYEPKHAYKSKIFNHYLERAQWPFNEYQIPIKKLIRNKILRKLRILKY